MVYEDDVKGFCLPHDARRRERGRFCARAVVKFTPSTFFLAVFGLRHEESSRGTNGGMAHRRSSRPLFIAKYIRNENSKWKNRSREFVPKVSRRLYVIFENLSRCGFSRMILGITQATQSPRIGNFSRSP